MMIRTKQTGFTLLEVMVVIAILGLMAAMIVPNVMGQNEKARIKLASTEMSSLASALDMYKLDNPKHNYPDNQQGLQALMEEPDGAGNWWGPSPYLKKEAVDPWGTPFVYVSHLPESDSYDLYSLGSDGKKGGCDASADISYFKNDSQQNNSSC